MDTTKRILTEAVKLFAREGFDAVTVEMIAEAVGIKAPSLYKHYKGKRAIFNAILKEMERRDMENARQYRLPLEPYDAVCTGESSLPRIMQDVKLNDYEKQIKGTEYEDDVDVYDHVDMQAFLDYCRKMFRYWTEDEFAASFRRMLTVEQYKSLEMNELYHQYLGSGPLKYTSDIVGSEKMAIALYGPMYILYSMYDETVMQCVQGAEDAIFTMLDEHLKNWYAEYDKQLEQK